MHASLNLVPLGGVQDWSGLKRLAVAAKAQLQLRYTGDEFDVEPVRRLLAEVEASGDIMLRLHGSDDLLAVFQSSPGFEDPDEEWAARDHLVGWLEKLADARIAHYRLI